MELLRLRLAYPPSRAPKLSCAGLATCRALANIPVVNSLEPWLVHNNIHTLLRRGCVVFLLGSHRLYSLAFL